MAEVYANTIQTYVSRLVRGLKVHCAAFPGDLVVVVAADKMLVAVEAGHDPV
jgi:hypothetical protein